MIEPKVIENLNKALAMVKNIETLDDERVNSMTNDVTHYINESVKAIGLNKNLSKMLRQMRMRVDTIENLLNSDKITDIEQLRRLIRVDINQLTNQFDSLNIGRTKPLIEIDLDTGKIYMLDKEGKRH